MNDLILSSCSGISGLTAPFDQKEEGIQMNGKMMGGKLYAGHYCIYEISPVEGKIDDLEAVKEMRQRIAEDLEKMDQIIKMLEDGSSYKG